jgi:hypothetical protein
VGILINIGIVHGRNRFYSTALRYFFKALDILELNKGDKNANKIIIFNNIAETYMMKG